MKPMGPKHRLMFLICCLLIVACGPSPNATPNEDLPKTQTDTPLQPRLRILNQSSVSLTDLIVLFPEDRIEFGDVPSGVVTEYIAVPNGVYRYAAYTVTIDGRKYEQPVIDWVGESPVQGNDFTYVIDVDRGQWTTQGQVILLIEVKVDR